MEIKRHTVCSEPLILIKMVVPLTERGGERWQIPLAGRDGDWNCYEILAPQLDYMFVPPVAQKQWFWVKWPFQLCESMTSRAIGSGDQWLRVAHIHFTQWMSCENNTEVCVSGNWWPWMRESHSCLYPKMHAASSTYKIRARLAVPDLKMFQLDGSSCHSWPC